LEKRKIPWSCQELNQNFLVIQLSPSYYTDWAILALSPIHWRLSNDLGCFSQDRSDGVATLYGRHGPSIESRWRQDLPHLSRLALGPTQPLVQCVLGLFPVVTWLDRGGYHPPQSSAKVKKADTQEGKENIQH
jgi:hypothetical protein